MEKDIRVLIVDDEPEARELLQFILADMPDFKVVGLAGDVDQAMGYFTGNPPDLVFLDIHMPDKDGFQLIDYIRREGLNPGIIFVTAFDNYAIKAIRNSVFDYILKPIRKSELQDALERFKQSARQKKLPDLKEILELLREPSSSKVKLNTRSGYILIAPSDVVFCEADGNYTNIQLLNGNRELTTQNLGAIEEVLDGHGFFRASRSYLVNLRFLSRVDRKSASCILEYNGKSSCLKIPSQKIRLLEASFS